MASSKIEVNIEAVTRLAAAGRTQFERADKEKMIAAITELMQGATMSELEFVLGYLTA